MIAPCLQEFSISHHPKTKVGGGRKTIVNVMTAPAKSHASKALGQDHDRSGGTVCWNILQCQVNLLDVLVDNILPAAAWSAMKFERAKQSSEIYQIPNWTNNDNDFNFII